MYTYVQKFHAPIWKRLTLKGWFYMCAGLFVVLCLLYVYMVNKTIMNVVARSSGEKQIAALSSEMSEMEAHYITLQNNLTITAAYAKGFTDATPVQYVSRDRSLTYNVR